MKRKNVFMITSTFPYGNMEPFIEVEINYLAKNISRLTVCPQNRLKRRRAVPENVHVSDRLVAPSWYKMALMTVGIFFSKEFYAEIMRRPEIIVQYKSIRSLLYLLVEGKRIKREIIRLIESNPEYRWATYYAYWCEAAAFAISAVKKRFPEIRFVSRCHRYDLYEEARHNQYMSLNKSYVKNADLICPVSHHGMNYLVNRYGIDIKKIAVHRLGVRDPGCLANISGAGMLNVVSCSNVVPVKRIHLIVDGLAHWIEKNDHRSALRWTHLGDGLLLDELKSYAEKKLKKKVAVCWKGQLDNSSVIKFYAENAVDGFINLSASEGIPVSIMEAASFGIPVIATDVGGTSEIVNEFHNILLEKNFSMDEFCEALSSLQKMKSNECRMRCKKEWRRKYNSEDNYIRFIKEVL